MCIPLCHMHPLPLAQSINEVNVQGLENKFVIVYRDGACVLYVSIYDNQDLTLDITKDISSFWIDLWRLADEHFDSFANDKDLAHMMSKMFFVWKRNH